MTELVSLSNHLLIAVPSMTEGYFARSLTYVCEHNEQGAMGIVINQPSTMTLRQLLEQTDADLHVDDARAEQIILAGGPVNQERGFVLHSGAASWGSSLQLTKDIAVTTSRDILSAIGTNAGPSNAIIALGYAGWSAGQLEAEIQENTWLIVEADEEIMFHTPIHKRWQAAVNKLGIDVWQLAPGIGHA